MDFPLSAVERAMQIKEVLLRAMNKEYNWLRAPEILGITPRGLRRLRQRMEQFGYQGLVDMRRGRPSPRKTPVVEIERILGLYRDRYRGFNARHFCSTVRREHGVKLSYSCVKQILQGAGLIERRKARGRHRMTMSCSPFVKTVLREGIPRVMAYAAASMGRPRLAARFSNGVCHPSA